ncbi:GNAT family N-acetyltransferase [Saccharothrix longispora]|uniref:GNAT family N-acetyltransferase n=1 Tax=Saccharothrix longispora TaxID=33920 RepID=UPI0028FD49AE|nr:GNAT family N-acetyltransferase [Saccharothrix longispora]MDU0291255.1 GNAT family N-acetyltransferase [Saccharothrix longispora]
MTDHDIRVLDDAEYRAAHTLFRGTLHYPPAPDDQWEYAQETYDAGRVLGAFADGGMIGTVQSFPSAMAVPGGAVVRHAAVSRVGVRADWTRRGVLSALQRAQLSAMRAAGDVVASLRASETAIYGRFGYGVASRYKHLRIDRRRAAPRSRVVGRVRLVGGEEGERIARGLFDELSPVRAGTISRWPAWWGISVRRVVGEENLKVAVRSAGGVDDGYVIYKVTPGVHDASDEKPSTLTVMDLWARSAEAWADLWLFVLGVDLVDRVEAPGRPVDEPVEWLLGDRRACRLADLEDESWLRLLDVPAALAARAYRPAPSVVVAVRDAYLPENAGSYRISAEDAVRTGEAADLVLDVDALASVYLGDVSFGTLAGARRLEVATPGAAARADALFAVDEVPWSGTFF